jgi:4a-hydroxytetrahydrobiopterin dehydratase
MPIETPLQTEPMTAEKRPLSNKQTAKLSTEVFGWAVANDDDMPPHIWRTFVFEDFADAIHFTELVGKLAENQEHHPKIATKWGEVSVIWWTDNVSGLHRNDFIMAAKTNDIYDRWDEITGKKETLDQALEDTFPGSDPVSFNSQIE